MKTSTFTNTVISLFAREHCTVATNALVTSQKKKKKSIGERNKSWTISTWRWREGERRGREDRSFVACDLRIWILIPLVQQDRRLRWPVEMAWLLILSSVIVIWIASLFKILHGSYSPSKGTFLNDSNDDASAKKRNVLLVVAHPDDESMFFTPTINYLTSRGHNIHILCLSIGDADGKGNTRKEELYKASATLKVPHQQVKILDHPDLQDGFGKVWNHNLLAKIIEEEVVSQGIDLMITFDNYGVSGHCNHCDVHYGVRKLLLASSHRNVEAWELVSTNIFRKYSGPVDIWFSNLYFMQCSNEMLHCLVNEQPRKSFLAMAQHASQWVWFRKLFVAFSSCTYVNTLRKMK